MPEILFRGFVAIALVLMGSIPVEGHGRNSTVIRADVHQTEAVVAIQAVLLDLLGAGGVAPSLWKQMPQSKREQVLDDCGVSMANQFRLVQARGVFLHPESIQVETWDLGKSSNRWMNLDQQSIEIKLRYAFQSPPGELTFWQQFRDLDGAENVHSQLMIRQKGELVMLPAELGGGMLVSFLFDWSIDPEPIAERKSLSAAACGPQNRPANAVLRVEESSVDFHVNVPVPREHRQTESLERFRNRVLSGACLLVNGTPCTPEFIDEDVRVPGSGPHSLAARGPARLVALSFRSRIAEPIDTVELGFALPDLDIPVLYLSVQETSKPVECFIVPAGAATHTWSSTH